MTIWTPSNQPVMLPGEPERRLIPRPDLRHSLIPRQSGERLFENEVDYDDLQVLQQWRVYEPDRPNEVRYFMMQVSQRNPGDAMPWVGYKAIRFARLTRVPRWLRQQGSGVSHGGNSQMTYVLAALRESGVLFVQLVTKSPDSQLIFAYGVQALGATPEEAQQRADEAYATLIALLDGQFQQIEYAPLTLTEGERIVRQQNTWNNIAVARGRPMLNTDSIGASALLDGNRTDQEATAQQMEAFIRGMSEQRRGFMLTLVTVPLAVADMNIAVSNIARHLSVVRSETRGNRAFSAGVAIPLTVGAGEGHTQSDSHSTSTSFGETTTDGTSFANSQSQSQGDTTGTTNTTSQSTTDGTSNSQSSSSTSGTSSSQSNSSTTGNSATTSQSVSDGSTTGTSQSTSTSNTEGTSTSSTAGSTTTEGISQSSSTGVTETATQSATVGFTEGSNWSTGTSGSSSYAESTADSESYTNTSSGTIGLIGGSNAHQTGTTWTHNSTTTEGFSATAGGSASTSSSATAGSSVGTSSTVQQGLTSSAASSLSATAGMSQSATAGQTAGTSQSTSVANTAGTSASTSSSATVGATQGTSQSSTSGSTQGTSHSATSGSSQANSTSSTSTTGSSTTNGTSNSLAQNQQMSDAYAVAMSRQAQATGSLGVIPSFGVSASKETLDAGKQLVGDILEEQMKRYVDGVEGGAFMYQMFFTAEDTETLHAGAALLKSAFWGPGGANRRLAQPFHVVADLESAGLVTPGDSDGEKQRLLNHAMAFSSYRRREPSSEVIEPFLYSSYVTCGEMSTFSRPPTAEAVGLLAVHDSAPVMAMPGDREDRDATVGYVFNGERGRVSNTRIGFDVDELTHMLFSGVTGSGKTTTLMRLMSEIVQYEKTVTKPSTGPFPSGEQISVGAGVLALDWMANNRHLGSLLEPVSYDPVTGSRSGRYQFFSVSDPTLGAFRFNPLAVPAKGMSGGEWLNAVADNMVASWGLGEFGRSLIAEYLDELFIANRLADYEISPADPDSGRPAVILPALDRTEIPEGGLHIDDAGNEVANVYTCAELSRLIGVQHLAEIVKRKMREVSTVEGGRQGVGLRDRLQSLWRRLSYFDPNGMLADMISYDVSLNVRRTLQISDLVDPDAGLVTVIETDGLDIANRRFILGSLVLALYRSGLHKGEGCFNHNGAGPGLFVVLEEAHELFGSHGEDDDAFSAGTRTALYESLHRRVRALGVRLIDVVQNPADVPEAITSNLSTVFIHRTYDKKDRDRVFSLLSWSNQIGQQLREYRFLGELPVGHVICRLHARHHYLESAPIHFVCEQAALGVVTNEMLAHWATYRSR